MCDRDFWIKYGQKYSFESLSSKEQVDGENKSFFKLSIDDSKDFKKDDNFNSDDLFGYAKKVQQYLNNVVSDSLTLIPPTRNLFTVRDQQIIITKDRNETNRKEGKEGEFEEKKENPYLSTPSSSSFFQVSLYPQKWNEKSNGKKGKEMEIEKEDYRSGEGWFGRFKSKIKAQLNNCKYFASIQSNSPINRRFRERDAQIQDEIKRLKTVQSTFTSLDIVNPVDSTQISSTFPFKLKVDTLVSITETIPEGAIERISKLLKESNDTILIEKFNIPITVQDLKTLQGTKWLNDQIINFYFLLVAERSILSLSFPPPHSLPRIHVFNTFFYPKLRDYGYESVSRWTRRIDIFTNDIILIPIHLGVHWCLAVIDFEFESISYYDSLYGNGRQCLESLLDYLQKEWNDKRVTRLQNNNDRKGGNETNVSISSIVTNTTNSNHNHIQTNTSFPSSFSIENWMLFPENSNKVPKQMNGYDCGVFACIMAEYASKRAPFTFDQKHMPHYRNKMSHEIITGQLM